MSSEPSILDRRGPELKALHRVRAVALTDYAIVARAVGLDATAMLENFGLNSSMLADSEARLPAQSVAKLLEASARASRRDDFGVLMAKRRTFKSLGPIAKVLTRLGSLREIIDAASALRRQMNDVFELEIRDGEARAESVVVKVLPQFAGSQALYLITAMTHVLLRGASHGAWKPKCVHFPTPRVSDPFKFELFFGAPVKFGEAICAFECERGTLDRQFRDDPLTAASELMSSIRDKLMRLEPGDQPEVTELRTLLEHIQLQLRENPGATD